MKRTVLIVILSLIALGVELFTSFYDSAKAVDSQCSQVTAIFARGSGQELQQKEAERFIKQLSARLGTVSLNTSELGSQEYGEHQYPAVSVDPWYHTGTIFGAWISQGYANKYGESVMEGEKELFYRLVNIHASCPNSRIVLAGYSQGAQVMGQALGPIDTQPEIRDQIEFVALFGDPKLNLPEGRGIFPPACKHEQYSPWRREVTDCNTDNGSLGARDPYVPDTMKDKVGLWCVDNDLVCGSSKLAWVNSGHGKYYKDDGPIDHAVHEIVERLQEKIAMQDVNLVPDMLKIPSGHPDVMIVLDNSTENMPGWSEFVVPTTFAIANQVTQRGGRVGLQTYNGCVKKGYTYSVPLSQNPGQLEDETQTLWHFNAQCDLSQDLITTVNRIKDSPDWKTNRNKIIVVIPKVSFSIPGTTTSTSLADQSDLHIYSIEPDGTDGGYSNLRIDSYKNTPIKLSDFNAVLVKNTTNPQVEANLLGPNVIAPPGTAINYDASSSIVYDDTIDRYEWDFDGNSTIDQTTTEPRTTHTYASPFNGEMSVTVVTTSGISDSVTQKVLIQSASMFKQPVKAPVNLKLTKLSDSSVHLTWDPGDDSAIAWLIKVDDFPLGYTKKDQHYINISDIPIKERHVITVQGLVDDDADSEVATISTDDLNPPSKNLNKAQEKKDEASTFDKQAAEILGQATKKNREDLNPAAQAVSKLNPATKSLIRGSLILIVVASASTASILGWLLYKHRKALF